MNGRRWRLARRRLVVEPLLGCQITRQVNDPASPFGAISWDGCIDAGCRKPIKEPLHELIASSFLLSFFDISKFEIVLVSTGRIGCYLFLLRYARCVRICALVLWYAPQGDVAQRSMESLLLSQPVQPV